METITYSEVQELVMRLPEAKLPLAYKLLAGLAGKDEEALSPQHNFMSLPLDERSRIMTEQAAQLLAHYEQTTANAKV